MKKIGLCLFLSGMLFHVAAQTEYMVVTKTDGSTVNVKIPDIDSVSFATFIGESLGTYTEDNLSVNAYDMEVNPITKRPVIFFYSNDNAASAAEFDGANWSNIGAKGFTETVPYNSVSLAFDAAGTPYAYFVNAEKFSQVMKYANGAWSNVGAAFGTVSTVSTTLDGIAIDSQGDPVVAFMASKVAGSVPKRGVDVSYFDGDSWLADNVLPGASGTNYLVRIFNAGGALYCAFIQQAGEPLGYKIFKYEGNFNWTLISHFLPENASQPNIAGIDWAVSNDGEEIYLIAGSDAITTGVWYPTVFRYRIAQNKWTQIGDPLPSAGGGNGATMQTASRFALTIDSKGDPMVFYKDYDNNDYPTVVTLDAATRQWNQPVVLENYTLSAKRIMLKSVEPGVQYAAYIKEVNGVNQVNVVKLTY